MKCVILAGGSGDSLWPLSRRQFPKQFMKIKEGRSILQETVVRNMPFCEEFIIVTNESYKNIVNGQMKAFQSLKYRVILEGTPKGTGAAVLLGTMFANPSELVLVVNSDNLIEGDGYKDSIIEAKEYAKEGYLAVLGIKPESQSSTYGYILRDKENVKKFIARIDFDEDETEGLLGYDYGEGYLWNSGILVFRAGDMINAARRLASELYTTCKTAKRKVPAIRRSVRFSETVMQAMPHGSIETLLLEKCDSIKVVEAHFEWMDVGNASDLAEFGNNIKSECVIKNDCDNVNIINNAPKRLVVANDLRDLVVVNTDDATYISSKKSADNIKQIMKDNMDTYEAFFDYNRTTYKEWGIQEILNYSQGYKVRKLTVFPGMSMSLHRHEKRTEHWSIVEGIATITLGNETADYNKYESVFIPVGTKHRIANKTDKNVVVIEVGIGDNISDTDLVKIYNKDNPQASANYVRLDKSPIAKLEPAFKDNLWGGTKIRDVYAKKEIEKVPLLNIWMKYLYCLFLDRKNMKEGLKTILTGIDYLKAGTSIVIFPEGTRNKSIDGVLPFHAGSFKLAEKSGCRIIPMVQNNTAAALEDHLPFFKKTHTVLEFGKPIDVASMDREQKKTLANDVQDLIEKMYEENKALV